MVFICIATGNGETLISNTHSLDQDNNVVMLNNWDASLRDLSNLDTREPGAAANVRALLRTQEFLNRHRSQCLTYLECSNCDHRVSLYHTKTDNAEQQSKRRKCAKSCLVMIQESDFEYLSWDGFQMSIKCLTFGGQMRDEEAAI